MILAQSVSSYFFWDEPKQFFVGAELCARWYQLLKGDLNAKTVNGVISYSQQAQEAFSWILAGKAISTLVGRVARMEWDASTAAALTDSFSQAGACGDIVINKLFESKVPRFKVLGYATDTLTDVIEYLSVIKTLSESDSYIGKFLVTTKSITSIFLTIISMSIYYGVQISRISLVFETVVFITRLVHYNLNYKSEKTSN